MIVAKFGGTSLASASQIKKVCDIITSEQASRIVLPVRKQASEIEMQTKSWMQ